MKHVLPTLTALIPEISEAFTKRYSVLQAVHNGSPVGRRSLAQRLGWSERVTRAEIDLLRNLDLLDVHGSGVRLTDAGEYVLEHAGEILQEMLGLDQLEVRLASAYHLKKVVIVPGDSDSTPSTRIALAHRTADVLAEVIQDDSVIAVSGGSTLADAAAHVQSTRAWPDVVVVPTGGGLGDTLRIEANTVAAGVATALKAKYRLLHIPDDLNQRSVATLLQDNQTLAEIFDLIRSASIVVQGVGTMQTVAERRGFSADEIRRLDEGGAVGESLGHFFNMRGEVVGSTSAVGLQIADLARVNDVIVSAGGSAKAGAIGALLSTGFQDVLVTDQAAAAEIAAAL